MQRLRVTLFFTIWICLLSAANGQNEYVINFKINGIKDTTCMVAYYYSNSTYIKDTLKVDGTGQCVYKKAAADLPKGLYVLVITDKIFFDFVINNDHVFSIETSKIGPVDHMVIKNSPENTLFYKYVQYNKEQFDKVQEIEKSSKDLTDEKSKKKYSDRIIKINKDLVAFKLGIVDKYPDSFTAFMINAMREPDVPEAPKLANGKPDSLFPYRYFKAHFWDGSDFTDDRLLRTPVFHNKLKKYFENIVVQNPDSIIKEVDIYVEKSRPNPEMFKYLIWFSTYRYENPEFMGFDKVFVHIVDKYYVTGQTTWLTSTVNENVIKKANKIRPLLLGQRAPNMIMQDTNLQLVSMHNISADFLLLLFWDPDCGHCEKEIPVLKEFYDQHKDKYKLEFFAVCSDTSMVKWKNSIKKKKMNWINVDGPRTLTGDFHEQYDIISTPVIYLLNDKKEIIAKRLPADKVGTFIENYLKRPHKP